MMECQDGVDNDNDNYIDYPADIGCSSVLDDDETNAPINSCYDTDGGSIYNVTGSTSGYYNGNPYSHADSCGSGTSLNEYYCSGTLESLAAYACTNMGANYVCSAGKCVYSPPPPPENTCSDTDGGITYNASGMVSGYLNGAPYSHSDYCSGTYLAENYCEGTVNRTDWHLCTGNYTCANSACVLSAPPPQNRTNCTDTDAYLPVALKYPQQSQIGMHAQCTDINGTYEDTSLNSTFLKEYYCYPQYNASGYIRHVCGATEYNCPNPTWNYTGSAGGACVVQNQSDICTDTDGGINWTVKGTMTGYRMSDGTQVNGTDYCYTNEARNYSAVTDYYCAKAGVPWRAINCSNVGSNYWCYDGACAPLRAPPSNQTNCTDTDGYLPAVLNYPLQSQVGVYATCTDYRGTYYDTSQNSTWTSEYSCYQYNSSENRCGLTVYNCLSWNYTNASGGKCIRNETSPPPSNNTCSDSDGGLNFTKNGTVSGLYNGAPYSHTEYCSSGTDLMEYACAGTNMSFAYTSCSSLGNYTCLYGECVRPQNNSCSDSDGGRLYNVSGSASGYYNGDYYTYPDQCFGTTTLYEHYCTGITNHSEMFTCASLGANYTCSAGKCILNQSGGGYPPLWPNCTNSDSYLPLTAKYPIASQMGVYANCTNKNGTIYWDQSVNSSHVKDYYCSKTTYQNGSYTYNCLWGTYSCISYNYTGSSGGKCYK
jgi:hypothetical protein